VQHVEGKVAVVTAAAGGIGRALAEEFLAVGAKVVVADIHRDLLDGTVVELASRGAVIGVVTDVTDPGSVNAPAAETYDAFGACHVLYSNSNAWARGLEGWHGIDQLGEDGANPNYEALIDRMKARFGRGTRNVVVALAYDTARAAKGDFLTIRELRGGELRFDGITGHSGRPTPRSCPADEGSR
jgi:NAD(P)-dependent dehydrogenase (short-subunit alcohol dehydrogenase family)